MIGRKIRQGKHWIEFSRVLNLLYNEIMARGWESKAVEDQIESAKSNVIRIRSTRKKSEQDAVRMRDRQGLELMRSRVQQQIERTQSPRYLDMLRAQLSELDQQISKL